MSEIIKAKYINLMVDWSFKRVFGTEVNKDILIEFLKVIFPQFAITDITYIPTEQLGIMEEDRKAIFDVLCKKNARRATFAEAVYSYPLDMQKFELGVVRTQFQRVSIGQQSFSDMVACTLSTLDSSYNAWNYASKRQLLGNAATEAAKKPALVSTLAKPTDTASGEAFIKKVKELVEIAKDMNDHNLAAHVCGAAPSLKLYVKQGVMPSLEVDTMAGAFNEAKLAVPAEIKTVLDFGTADANIYAILVDERAIKLHDDINKVTTDYTAGDDQDNFYRLLKQTGFISKFAFIHVFKAA